MEEFKVIKPLKPGGQKEVFFIEHPTYGKCIFKRGKCASFNSLERIKREVNIPREVNSCYFPKNYGADFSSNGEFTIFEEYIESLPLSEIVDIYIKPRKNGIETISRAFRRSNYFVG